MLHQMVHIKTVRLDVKRVLSSFTYPFYRGNIFTYSEICSLYSVTDIVTVTLMQSFIPITVAYLFL